MTREEKITELIQMANELTRNLNRYSKSSEMEIWTECSDWNSEHPDEEIFMCEHENDNCEVDGFYIEDDYWITKEEQDDEVAPAWSEKYLNTLGMSMSDF